jgi:hypothetical protein
VSAAAKTGLTLLMLEIKMLEGSWSDKVAESLHEAHPHGVSNFIGTLMGEAAME